MKKPLVAIGVVVGMIFLAPAETVVHDDFAGVRPDTGGVATNLFWDVRSRAPLTVTQVKVVSSTPIDGGWFSRMVSTICEILTDAPGCILFLR